MCIGWMHFQDQQSKRSRGGYKHVILQDGGVREFETSTLELTLPTIMEMAKENFFSNWRVAIP